MEDGGGERIAVVRIGAEAEDSNRVVAGQLVPQERMAGSGRNRGVAEVSRGGRRRPRGLRRFGPGLAIVEAEKHTDSIPLSPRPDMRAESNRADVAGSVNRDGHCPDA